MSTPRGAQPTASAPLRIFYASQTGCFGLPDSKLWYANLYLPLVELGHDVAPFDYDLDPHFGRLDIENPRHVAYIEEHRPRLEEALLDQVRRAHREAPVDVFFSYFYSACVRPETIRRIGEMGICTVNWYCNGSYQLHLVADIAPAYDFCLVPERYRLADYRRLGARPIYCQEAANPAVYRPYDVPREFDVTFAGQKYGDRPDFIRHLCDNRVDVRVWGMGWQPRRGQAPAEDVPPEACGSMLSDEELIRLYSRSKISLGFSKVGETHRTDAPIKQVRLRDFEAPMSGAFYLVEYQEEFEDFFEIGREIVCFEDADELLEKVRYYLKHERERERIRRAGLARCRREHTWHHRFEMVFDTIRRAGGLPRGGAVANPLPSGA